MESPSSPLLQTPIPIDHPYYHHQPLFIEDLNIMQYDPLSIEVTNNSQVDISDIQIDVPLSLSPLESIPSGGEAAKSLFNHQDPSSSKENIQQCNTFEVGMQTDNSMLGENIQLILSRKKEGALYKRINSLGKKAKSQDGLITNLEKKIQKISKAKTELERSLKFKNQIITDLQRELKKNKHIDINKVSPSVSHSRKHNQTSKRLRDETTNVEDFQWSELDIQLFDEDNRRVYNNGIEDEQDRIKLLLDPNRNSHEG